MSNVNFYRFTKIGPKNDVHLVDCEKECDAIVIQVRALCRIDKTMNIEAFACLVGSK